MADIIQQQQDSTTPRISTLSGDAWINHQMFDATLVACATKLFSNQVEGGLYALGILDTQESWAARHEGLNDAAGNAIPVPAFPDRPLRPIRPAAGCTQVAFNMFSFDVNTYFSFLRAIQQLDNELLIALGPDRIDEISSVTTGMSNISALDVRTFFRQRYGTLTMAKLSGLKDSIRTYSAKDAGAYFSRAARVHEIWEANGAPFNDIEKQECAALALENDTRLSKFYHKYSDKYVTMASRSYAALVKFILEQDASNPPASEPGYSNSAKELMSLRKASAAAADGNYDDDDDNNDDDGIFDQQSYQDGFTAGMSAASATTRSIQFGPNLDKRLDTLETTIGKLSAAISQLAKPSTTSNHYCFVHGSNRGHPGMQCGAMLNDNNYTSQMRKATKKCSLVANDGTTIMGAD